MENKIKFGIEIEFKKTNLNNITTFLKNNNITNFFVTRENNVTERGFTGYEGGELISDILIGSNKEWENLNNILNYMITNDAYINDECGLHFHINFEDYNLNKQNLKSLIAFWYQHEEIIYQYTTAELNRVRDCAINHADSIRPIINYVIANKSNFDLNDFISLNDQSLIIGKSYGLNISNFQNKINANVYEIPTIEFRCSNGTLNFELIKKYQEFFIRILDYIKNNQVEIKYSKKYCDFDELFFTEEELLIFINSIYKDNELEEKMIFYNSIKNKKNLIKTK